MLQPREHPVPCPASSSRSQMSVTLWDAFLCLTGPQTCGLSPAGNKQPPLIHWQIVARAISCPVQCTSAQVQILTFLAADFPVLQRLKRAGRGTVPSLTTTTTTSTGHPYPALIRELSWQGEQLTRHLRTDRCHRVSTCITRTPPRIQRKF